MTPPNIEPLICPEAITVHEILRLRRIIQTARMWGTLSRYFNPHEWWKNTNDDLRREVIKQWTIYKLER